MEEGSGLHVGELEPLVDPVELGGPFQNRHTMDVVRSSTNEPGVRSVNCTYRHSCYLEPLIREKKGGSRS